MRQRGNRQLDTPGAADTWLALSRPPFFTAVAVWFIGGTYYTGGYFPDRCSLWLGFRDYKPPDVGARPGWLSITPPREIPSME